MGPMELFLKIIEENTTQAIKSRQELLDTESGAGAVESFSVRNAGRTDQLTTMESASRLLDETVEGKRVLLAHPQKSPHSAADKSPA